MDTYTFSTAAQGLSSSVIREILKVTEQPKVISFAGGLPSPKSFPVQEIKDSFDKVLKDYPLAALQYGPSEGYRPLREWIAADFTQKGVKVDVDEVLVVSGSQQGIEMLGHCFVEPGAKLLVESPTYLGALQAFSLFQPHYETVSTDDEGLLPESITAEKAKNARFIYCLPNFQNPTGRTLSLARRQDLVKKAVEHHLPIVEDDPYGELRYEGEALPSLLQLGREAGATVIRFGTFSKILAPGLRMAYIIAPKEIIAKLVQIKQAIDLHSPSINQMAIYETIKDGFLKTHIPKIQALYQAQCQYMLNAMDKEFPKNVSWTRPKGGMFLWVTLPENVDTTSLLKRSVEEKSVAYVPGEAFYTQAIKPKNNMRLSFVTVSKEKIDEGIAGLGALLKEVI
ncbi:aminotransferase-like domain-containing protein [Basilea psittacipulmonis]|uniref:2-aminoadipate aminotransferase n=1 Tax=Basilea psittacipulmonis DSM 24701 TaxID=1072685 RepID=A0A077DEH2_9BURK|nr:PLP-dependent aminotransferase family protein [Basilea psittacipulmonis]AIL33225.1 2-aminoadipate aminotransferase [Basilea psittacipulmonis DSM 24701]